MDDLLQQGETAFNAGNRDEARKIFITVVKQSPNSETAWSWMYQVSNSDQEKIHCLKQILRINPKSEKANQLLDTLAPSDFPFEALPNVISLTNFQTTLQSPTSVTPTNNSQNRFVWALGLIALLIVCVFAGGGIAYVYQAFSEINKAFEQVATQAPVQPTLSDMDYGGQAFALFESYNVVFDQILNMMSSYDSNYPENQNLIVKLNEIDRIATQINNLPPAPPNFREVESLMRRMSSETFLFTSAMRAAIATYDTSLLQEASVHQYYIIEVSYGAIIEAFPK